MLRSVFTTLPGLAPVLVAGVALSTPAALAVPAQPLDASAIEDDVDDSGAATTIVGRRTWATAGEARMLDDTNAPEDALDATLGLNIARDGGPLAPARVRLRGLGGSRTQTSIGPLVLDDAVTGAFDVASLPFFALHRVRTASIGSAGTPGARPGTSFELTPADVAFVRGRIGAGSFQTWRADLVMGAPLRESSRENTRGRPSRVPGATGQILGAASLSSTKGDFPFDIVTPTGIALAQNVKRANNDQLRGSALVHAVATPVHVGAYEIDGATTIFGAFHRGGIPGFSSAPPAFPYRGRKEIVAAAATARVSREHYWSAISLQARSQRRAVHIRFTERATDEDDSALATFGGDARFDVGAHFDTIAVNAWTRALAATLVDGRYHRAGIAGGAQISATFFQDRVHAMLSSDVGVLSDALLTTTTAATLEGGFLRGLRGGVRAGIFRRAPTLDELYAPQGLTGANPGLQPETSVDGEVFVRFTPRRILVVEGAFFAGRIVDAIVYVSRNAFEIAPTNTGGANRAGGEGRIAVSPHRFFSVDVIAQGLWSEIDDTRAPLPRVPSFSSRVHARLGSKFGAAIHASLRTRSAVPNTLFGTLSTPAYAIADISTRIPVGTHLAFGLSMSNIFNVRTATDSNLLPLPGRSFFFSLEVSG